MNIDVFISHSSKDANIANAICNTLESNNIRCWIAPRDVEPGNEWAQSINAAIESSKVTVLIFSENSNSSQHVAKELNLSIHNNHFIFPFKADNSTPTGSMKYYLSDLQMLDGTKDNFETQIEELKNRINSKLEKKQKDISQKLSEDSSQKPPKKDTFIILGMILLLLTLAVCILIPNEKSSVIEEQSVVEKVAETSPDENRDIISELRNSYYEVKSNLKNLTKKSNGYSGVTYYYDKDYELIRIDVPGGLTDSASKQYYLKDREIYFVLSLDRGKETQLYFQNGKLIMHIDATGVAHDYSGEIAQSEKEYVRKLEESVFIDLRASLDSSVYTASNIIKKVETSPPAPVRLPRDEVIPYSPDWLFSNNEFGISLAPPYKFYSEHTNYDAMSSILSTDDGSAKLKICAGYNKGGVTPEDLYNEFLNIYGGTIDYTYSQDTKFAVRLLEGDNCHYAYYSVRYGVIRGFEFHFTGQKNYDIYIEYINHLYDSLKYRSPNIALPTDYADNWIIGDWDIDTDAMEFYEDSENESVKIIKSGKNKITLITNNSYSMEYVFIEENTAISIDCLPGYGEQLCIGVCVFDEENGSFSEYFSDADIYFGTGKVESPLGIAYTYKK